MTKIKPKIVLCSGSPRRMEMLKELGIPFEIQVPDVPEEWDGKEPPERFAVRLAASKAAQAQARGNALRIGMDTIVVVGRRILGKPLDSGHAQQMLRMLSGKSHRVITGVSLACKSGRVTGFESTSVRFRRLSQDEIRWYVQTGEPLDKAGAYAIQGFGRLFITRIEGCYFNVVGFPVSCFQRLLKRLNLSIFDLVRGETSSPQRRKTLRVIDDVG